MILLLCFIPISSILAAANGNYKIEEGICNTGTTIQIPRADVAHFMLSALQTKEYDRKEMAVASL